MDSNPRKGPGLGEESYRKIANSPPKEDGDESRATFGAIAREHDVGLSAEPKEPEQEQTYEPFDKEDDEEADGNDEDEDDLLIEMKGIDPDQESRRLEDQKVKLRVAQERNDKRLAALESLHNEQANPLLPEQKTLSKAETKPFLGNLKVKPIAV